MAAPKRFAPLKPGATNGTNAPKLQGVVFDVDGTLCEPQTQMFTQMRHTLSIPKSTDILTHISTLPPSAQSTAMSSIRAIERTFMLAQVAQPGLRSLMDFLDSRGVRKGICTRNFEQPVRHLLGKFLEDSVFEPVVTREFRPTKPDPAGVLHIAASWGLIVGEKAGEADSEKARVVDGENGDAGGELRGEGGVVVVDGVSITGDIVGKHEGKGTEGKEKEGKGDTNPWVRGDASQLLMVGDSIDDMTAGRKAGAATVLLANSGNGHLVEHDNTDLVIGRLDELIGILEEGFVGRDIRGGGEE